MEGRTRFWKNSASFVFKHFRFEIVFRLRSTFNLLWSCVFQIFAQINTETVKKLSWCIQDIVALFYVFGMFTFHYLLVSWGEIHRKCLAKDELRATFQWQSQWCMWDHWKHDNSLGRKSKRGKGHSIHGNRKMALLRKTFHCTSCLSTRSSGW